MAPMTRRGLAWAGLASESASANPARMNLRLFDMNHLRAEILHPGGNGEREPSVRAVERPAQAGGRDQPPRAAPGEEDDERQQVGEHLEDERGELHSLRLELEL